MITSQHLACLIPCTAAAPPGPTEAAIAGLRARSFTLLRRVTSVFSKVSRRLSSSWYLQTQVDMQPKTHMDVSSWVYCTTMPEATAHRLAADERLLVLGTESLCSTRHRSIDAAATMVLLIHTDPHQVSVNLPTDWQTDM